ncbi:MAG TPA: acetyl-CoA C-acyltransferase, partial [Gemmatimonadetes bacterium]|nr:acetyl-CoA C-acyltransferase [Gemmatimonadota bacterium]
MSDASRIPVLLKGGARTPIGRFLGGLSHFSAPELGAIAVRASVERSGIDVSDVEEVIMGNVVTAGAGQAPARQAAVGGGVPETVPALTINKVCGSGLKAVMLAAQAVRAGDARLIVAGGMESMSMVPHYLRGMRNGIKFGDQGMDDGLIFDGLWCSFGNCHMGGYAEYTANKAGVSRDAADEFSLRSHQKAVAAAEAGFFENEIVPVEVKKRKSVSVIDVDESPRGDTSLDALGKLRPAFVRDAPDEIEEHVVTAGNAPGLNDGAASVIVASLEYAEAHGLEVEALISGYATAATAPQDLFFAPIAAVQN